MDLHLIYFPQAREEFDGKKRKKRTRYARFGVFALLLSMLVSLPAFAAGSANVVRTFVYENNLYTYVELNEIERPVTQVEAKIGGQSFSASGRLETVRQAGYPITYLLLVDNSNSMPPFREQLLEFCQGLSEASGENTRFVLAAFGEEFQILDEGLTVETLEGPLSEIPLDETETHLHSSIDEALDYFEGLPRNGNELRAVVVLTDGVQYDPLGGVSYEELLERVRHSDVMLHSVGFGSDSEALDSLGQLSEASGGTHQVLSQSLPPKEASEALSDAGGRLMVTSFDLTGCSAGGQAEAISFTFAANGTLLCRGVGEADLSALSNAGEVPGEGAGAETAGEPSGGALIETEKPSEGAEAEPAEETLEEETQEEETAKEEGSEETLEEKPEETADETTGGEAAGERTEEGQKTGAGGMLVVAAAAVAVIIAAILIVLKRGKGQKNPEVSEPSDVDIEDSAASPETAGAEDPASAFQPAGGIYMRVEAKEGVLSSEKNELTLDHELTAGRDPSCDIVLLSEEIPPKAVRIFIEDGPVYIEALGSKETVMLNGNALQGTQRLYSGDRIAVCGQEFRLFF